MDKVIGYLAFVFRLAFLPFRKQLIRKKWKIAILLATNIVMMYAVITVSIQPHKSIYRQVEDVYGTERSILDLEQSRLNSIIFNNARRLNPNMITIVPTAELDAQQKQDSIDAASALRIEDQLFLLSMLKEK